MSFLKKSIKKSILVVSIMFFGIFILGALPSKAEAATLYFNNAVDTSWDTLGNWWDNAAFNDPAATIPATNDTVYIGAQLDTPPSLPVTLTHIHVADASTGGGNFVVRLTGATGNATFNDESINTDTVTGNATFNDASYNGDLVNGNATFNNTSRNEGRVTGNATFNTTYYHTSAPSGGVFTISLQDHQGVVDGTVFGTDAVAITSYVFTDFTVNFSDELNSNVTFNDETLNQGAIIGDVILNDTSANFGTITGNATFNTTYYHTSAPSGGVFTFSLQGQRGSVTGTVFGTDAVPITSYVFGDGTVQRGTINDDAVFNGGATSIGGTINGDATFNDTSSRHHGGTISGTATFNDTSHNDSNLDTGIFNDESYNGSNVVMSATFNDQSYNSSGVNADEAVFNDQSYNAGEVSQDGIFNDESYNNSDGTVVGNATFNDTSHNDGTVNGNATFACEATNTGTVDGTITNESCAVEPSHSSGSSGGQGPYSPPLVFSPPLAPRAAPLNADQINTILKEITEKLKIILQKILFQRDLTINSTGKDVSALQDFLISEKKGAAAEALRQHGVTNNFGPLTRSALAEFQRAVGIQPAIGYFGPLTRAYLKSIGH